MGRNPWWRRAVDWLTFLPVNVAFLLIALAAKLGNRDARDVLRAMWNAGLDVPESTP